MFGLLSIAYKMNSVSSLAIDHWRTVALCAYWQFENCSLCIKWICLHVSGL